MPNIVLMRRNQKLEISERQYRTKHSLEKRKKKDRDKEPERLPLADDGCECRDHQAIFLQSSGNHTEDGEKKILGARGVEGIMRECSTESTK